MKTAQELYPDCLRKYFEDDLEEHFSSPVCYLPLVRNLGRVIIEVSDSDWQGSSRFLLEKEGKYAILCYTWGSCSYCDSLQGCQNYEELQDLMDGFNSRLEWKSKEEIFEKIEFESGEITGFSRWDEEEDIQFVNELKSWMESERG